MGDSTNHNHVDHSENGWTVTISIREWEGQTRATARLQCDGRKWKGVGLSRLSPSERGVAGVGGQQAISRALSDLARHLTVDSGMSVASPG